jgi:hypothetical protein
VGWVFGIAAFSLGLVFLWGLFAPRGQWRALAAWSVSDEHQHEPGGATYALRRVISGIGLVSLLAVAGVTASSALTRTPTDAPPETALQAMWGPVAPSVINRMVVPTGTVPAGLVEVPVLGYQSFDDGIPSYVVDLADFALLGNASPNGYVGDVPPVGNGALDFSDMVINVRGPLLCIPRVIVMTETETEIRVGAFYGLPINEDGTEGDAATGCAASAVSASVLVPLQLSAPVGDRLVVALDGTPISEVPIISG